MIVLAVGLLVYIALSRLVMRWLAGVPREVALAMLNLGGLFVCFYTSGLRAHGAANAVLFALYLVLVLVQYVMLRAFAEQPGGLAWLAFFTPILVLVCCRYVPGSFFQAIGAAAGLKYHSGLPAMVGISYLAFRCSRLVLEIRNGTVPKPSFLEYFNFAFFLPTMPVGPINTYANFRRGFTERYEVPIGVAGMRILVGAVKYLFLGNLCNQLTYSGMLLYNHPHPWIDLPLAMLFYYLFLYLNFSGFCDMAIGAAGLIGVAVPENFESPFAARNVKDFWNRWHITLSVWMRDVVFSPLSKFLVGQLGLKLADHAIALTIAIVFLLVGIWHGVGWNFVVYGATHALGVVANHYYTIFLKKKLGRAGFKAYNENRWIRAVAVVLTFCYCGASLIFFANTFPQIKEILSTLR